MKDKDLLIFRNECRSMQVVYMFRNRFRNKLKETEYYLSKPDQMHSHLFAFKSQDSGFYLEKLSKKYMYNDKLDKIEHWINEIEHIIDSVPAVSMKYFIWVIWLEQKNCMNVAEQYRMVPAWLSRMIREQLKEAFEISGVNLEEMNILEEIMNVQSYYRY